MRWVFGSLLAICLASGVFAQQRPLGYPEAEQEFHRWDVGQRVTFQILLTAAGYWPAVPNENFSARIFQAITRFQSENGYSASGVVAKDQIERLLDLAEPNLEKWGFRKIAHPSRGRSIWVPVGLGLRAERTKYGLMFTHPRKEVSLAFHYFEGYDVADGYHAHLMVAAKQRETVTYKVLRDDFFAINAASGGTSTYVRYHADGNGILGFQAWWKDTADVYGERMVVLTSGSLWAAMTGARFIDPPSSFRSGRDVAAAQPPASGRPPRAEKADKAERPSSSGTGFFVTAEGHIVTNNHVVDSCLTILIKPEEAFSAPARVMARDRVNDFALLKADYRPTKVATIRAPPRLGESVAAFGFPLADFLASSGNFTVGNITALAGLGDDTRYLQVSAPVQAGNSGGPLVDENGNVIGIVTAKLNAIKTAAVSGDLPQNVNFAIKASLLTTFLDSNRIAYRPAVALQKLSPPDLADHAKTISAFIKCD